MQPRFVRSNYDSDLNDQGQINLLSQYMKRLQKSG